MSKSVWQAQQNLVQDFVDLFLVPDYPFPIEKAYPHSPIMDDLITGCLGSLDLPDTKLLRLDRLGQESDLEQFSRTVDDWATLYAYNVLEGFGHKTALDLDGDAFAGLKKLAASFGAFLGRELRRLFAVHGLLADLGSLMATIPISLFSQMPARELGEAIRESITPVYIRTGETVRHELALLNGDQAQLRESRAVLEASDAELEREIASALSGYSSEELGKTMQRMVVEGCSQLAELFSDKEFAEKLVSQLPGAFTWLAWYLGRRLQSNLRHDPKRMTRLLQAMERHEEIPAVLEMYRYRYGWQGDRSKAVALGWQVVAPKYFHLSPRVGDIKNDEGQEKLIGVAQGLEDYTNRNTAMVAIEDGFLGKLGAYLKRAAANQETDYLRKQTTDGNIALTEAKHAEDFRSQDEDEDGELSDEEILSQEKEKRRPSRNTVAEEVEAKEIMRAWYSTLTEQERTAVDLKVKLDNEEEIARRMRISQQRVSQLLGQALKKWQKSNC